MKITIEPTLPGQICSLLCRLYFSKMTFKSEIAAKFLIQNCKNNFFPLIIESPRESSSFGSEI